MQKLERWSLVRSACASEKNDNEECGAEMREDRGGEYVLYDDVESLLADLNGEITTAVREGLDEAADRLCKAVDNEF